MKTINDKVKQLLELNGNQFVYVDYYSHTGKYMWKIDCVYTKYSKYTIVLEDSNTPFEEILDLAISIILERKTDFISGIQ